MVVRLTPLPPSSKSARTHPKRNTLTSHPIMADLLSKEDVKRLLKKIPEWEHEGKKLTRTIEWDDFQEAIDFINDLAEIVEDAGHHPDIEIHRNVVILSLTTHEAGGITEMDFDVAERIDNLVD